MTIDEFWNIVEQVHAAAPVDMDAKCRLLEQELLRLPLAEVLSFERHFGECFHQANTWDIWGAAYLIHRGCGDDSFMDFRSTLISLGRRPVEAALADADSLADFDIDPKWACYEGYQYVARKVYRERYKYEPSENREPSKYPRGTRGEPFDEGEMTPRFPRLVAKFKHKDVDPEVRKENRRHRDEYEAATERVRKILLEGIIPQSGLVPPPRIVKQVLSAGKSPKSSGLNHAWQPFALAEGNFWNALTRLEKPSAGDLDTRPDLQGKRITLDTGCGASNDYEQWISSLKERDLL